MRFRARHASMDKAWVIVGGADRGGVLVRRDSELGSEKEAERLEHGAIVQELELTGERLHYRLLYGTGPQDGWISTRLPDKDLAVPLFPDWVTRPGGLPQGGAGSATSSAMTFYAISDVHVEKPQNMAWLEELPKFERSTVIVAGDLGIQMEDIERALALFLQKFDHVCYCFGNHETWVHKALERAPHGNSFEKLRALQELCHRLGVFTTPQIICGVWVVPVLGWYHASWDTEPPLQPPPGKRLTREPTEGLKLATDTAACNWNGLQNGSLDLARALDSQNEAWGIWPLPQELLDNLKRPRGERENPVISFSHFLPHVELMPEKRFLFQPNLTQIVGSNFVRDRVRQLEPDLHIFGHTHFPWDMRLADGVRYRSWPLGTPEEQARRIASIPTKHVEQWYPFPMFDSGGRHYSGDEACWFAMMYTRIKRDPTSCRMADYVRLAFCPDAPAVPLSIISPCSLLQPEDDGDIERREKYSAKSRDSIKRKIKNSGGSVKDAGESAAKVV